MHYKNTIANQCIYNISYLFLQNIILYTCPCPFKEKGFIQLNWSLNNECSLLFIFSSVLTKDKDKKKKTLSKGKCAIDIYIHNSNLIWRTVSGRVD